MINRTKPNLQGVPVVKYAIFGLAGLIVLSAAIGSTYVIDPGRLGVVQRFGEIVNIAPPGLHFKVPFIDDVIEIPSSLQTLGVNTTSVSKDIQEIQTNLNVQYSIPVNAMEDMYTNYRGDIQSLNNAVIGPGTESVTKAITARFTAEELISQRESVATQLKDALAIHLARNAGVTLAKIDITHFGFSASFTEAIEAKVVAEQAVLTESQNLERRKVSAQQQVAEASADAEAIRLRADAESYAIQKQNQYASDINVRMREAEAKIKAADAQIKGAEAMMQWRPNVIGGTPLVSVGSGSGE